MGVIEELTAKIQEEYRASLSGGAAGDGSGNRVLRAAVHQVQVWWGVKGEGGAHTRAHTQPHTTTTFAHCLHPTTTTTTTTTTKGGPRVVVGRQGLTYQRR